MLTIEDKYIPNNKPDMVSNEYFSDTKDPFDSNDSFDSNGSIDFDVLPNSKDTEKGNASSESEDEDYQIHKPGVCHPTVMHNLDGYNIKPEQVVDIAPGEGKIPVNLHIEPNAEPLAFAKLFSDGRFHFNVKRKVPISVTNYCMHI